MSSGIYAITNTAASKQYVGSAVNLDRRWTDHQSKLRRGTHGNAHLQAAWDKYGAVAFIFSVLEVCEPDQLIACEQRWIDQLQTIATGYNIRPQAHSNRGLRLTPAQCANRSVVGQGLAADPQWRQVVSQRTREVLADPVVKARISQRELVRWQDPTYRATMVAHRRALKDNPVFCAAVSQQFQQLWTDPAYRERGLAHLRDLSVDPVKRAYRTQRLRAAVQDSAYRGRLSAMLRERYTDPTARARMADATRNSWADPSIREKRAAGIRARWQDPEYRERTLAARRERAAQRKAAPAAD